VCYYSEDRPEEVRVRGGAFWLRARVCIRHGDGRTASFYKQRRARRPLLLALLLRCPWIERGWVGLCVLRWHLARVIDCRVGSSPALPRVRSVRSLLGPHA
jgi:hypothetical protein